MEKIKIFFKEEKFLNNGKIVLDSLGDFKSEIQVAIEKELDIETTTRTVKGCSRKGINADSLNKELRKQLPEIHYPAGKPLYGETHVKNGVFFNSTKEGFDFSSYDEECNFAILRNQYIGIDGKNDGREKLIALYKEVKSKKKDWTAKIDASGKVDESIAEEKKSLTIVGEFQFGNWGLVYRDLFRVIGACDSPGVDFYIYITATGKLQEMLSNNIVNFKQAKEVFENNLRIIRVPTWIIGLDIKE